MVFVRGFKSLLKETATPRFWAVEVRRYGGCDGLCGSVVLQRTIQGSKLDR